jgi:hypothetical protein
MPSNTVKSVLSLVALLFFMGSSIVTGMGIFELNRTKSDAIGAEYLAPAAIANTLAVIFLIYLTSTLEDTTTAYKLLIITLLLAGLVSEIYLSLFSEEKVVSVFAYFIMAINFLFRGFLVIQYVQLGDWTSPSWGEMKTVSEIAKPAPKPVAEDDELRREFISKWDRIKNKILNSPEGLTSESTKDAWETVVKPAIASKTFTAEKLKEAAAKLKHADGTPVVIAPVDIRGGRKYRS